MKKVNLKITAIILTVLTIFSLFSLCTFAADENAQFGNTYTVMTDNGLKNLIHNKYYSLYYDRIFEAEYESLCHYSVPGMTQSVIESMTDEDSFVTVILSEQTEQSYYDYNTTTLKDVDILYAGTTTPLAVAKMSEDVAVKLLENELVEGIFPAFFSAAPLVSAIVGSGIMGDADCSSAVTAADARMIVRYSAGLDEISDDTAKMFFIQSDMNFDGNVDAADARLALRTSAGLEKEIEISLPYASYWKDF